MILCINQATKLAQFFLKGEKTYTGMLRLGITTDTQDATGTVIARKQVNAYHRDDLQETFKRFEGPLLQKPPVFSALKHKGTPLYKLARKGRPVTKPSREITIHYLRIKRVNLPDIEFEIKCSGGTYIRTLCADIGEYLGSGGHLKRLRRIESCGFNIEDAIGLKEIEKLSESGEVQTVILPMGKALKNLPRVVAPQSMVTKIRHGRQIPIKALMAGVGPDQPKRNFMDSHIQVLDRLGNLLAILKQEKGKTNFQYCCVFH
jgi:tRNA pseudouridine55 synthase